MEILNIVGRTQKQTRDIKKTLLTFANDKTGNNFKNISQYSRLFGRIVNIQNNNKTFEELRREYNKSLRSENIIRFRNQNKNLQTRINNENLLNQANKNKNKQKIRELFTPNEIRKRFIKFQDNQLTKFLESGNGSFNFKFESEDDIRNLLNKIMNVAENNILIKIGDKFFTLNRNFIHKLLDLLVSNIVIEENQNGSDMEFIYDITHNDNITIEFIEKFNNNLITGGFFKHYHTLPFDLTEFQIYTQEQANKNKDNKNCFIHSLEQGGFKNDEIYFIITGKDIPQRVIKQVAEKFNIYITIKRPETQNGKHNHHLKHYGNKENKHYELGLIEEHYFLIKKINMTSYSYENYDEVKNKKEWNLITDKNGKKDKRETRFLSSYDLINKLIKDYKFLTPINFNNSIDNIYVDDKLDYELIEQKFISSEYKDKKENPKYVKFHNVFFDFETTTEGVKHIPYLCCIKSGEYKKSFFGNECGRQMLFYLTELSNIVDNKNIRLIAHNVSYDIRFIYKYLFGFSSIERGKMLLRASCKFNNINIEIQDSYSLITSKLSNFTEMFGLGQTEKEIMPYSIYTQLNISKTFIFIDDILKAKELKTDEDKEHFINNCKKWNCFIDDMVNIIRYSEKYCEIDCDILEKGYNKYKEWINEICDLDIDNFVSLASLAHTYLLKEGIYQDVSMIEGSTLNFIMKCMVGGRTMTSENKKIYSNKKGVIFDAVSLYPSAMVRLGGYLKGRPKLLKNMSYDFLQKQDGYFIEIKILSIGKKYKFPLMSFKDENNIRCFSNDMEGKIINVDKTQLEDLINFHKIKFEVIRGFYYDEGRNMKLAPIIKTLFNERKQKKKEKNPIQNTYKLLLNSPYGKTLLKPIEDEIKYISAKEYKKFISKNYSIIKEIQKLDNGSYKIKIYKSIIEHQNFSSCGVEVLAMSKRIMNELMTLGDDLDIHYQDTDSIHINYSQLPTLIERYEKTYKRDLIGKDLSQFHNDLEINGVEHEYYNRAIYLGKKCYIEEVDDNGKFIYNIRMKGVSEDAILDKCKELKLTPFEIYEKLYNDEEIEFDLCCRGNKICFNYENIMRISTLPKFIRKVSFLSKEEKLILVK